MPGDPPSRTIWVGGLPKDIKDDELIKAFADCGRVVDTKIKHSVKDTFAFVQFADDRGYDKAISTMDQSDYFGSPMKVGLANGIQQRRPEGRGTSGRGDSRDRRDRSDRRDRDDPPAGAGKRHRDAYQDDRPPRLEPRPPLLEPRVRKDSRGSAGREGKGGPRDDSSGRRGGKGGRRADSRGRPADYRGDRGYDDDRKGRGRGRPDDDYPRRDGRHRDGRGPRENSRDVDRGRRRAPEDDDTSLSRLWVGGLPQDITERELQDLFARHGKVTEIVTRHSQVDTFGFVQYKNASHALSAIRDLNQSQHFGGTIKVAPAGGKGDKNGDRRAEDDRDTRDRGSGKGGRRGKGGRSRSRSIPRDSRPAFRGQKGNPAKGRKGGGKSLPRIGTGGLRHVVNLGNLPPDMDKTELFELGSMYGKVLLHELSKVDKNGCRTGKLEYGVRAEALQAYEDLNDRNMDEWEKKITAALAQRDA